jgi:hypothetical protein
LLEIVNSTPFETGSAVLADLDCSEIWVVAIKGTYRIENGEATIADKQERVCLVDEIQRTPGASEPEIRKTKSYFEARNGRRRQRTRLRSGKQAHNLPRRKCVCGRPLGGGSEYMVIGSGEITAWP